MLGLVAGAIEKFAEDFKKASPEEKERFIKSSVVLLETFAEEFKIKIGAERH